MTAGNRLRVGVVGGGYWGSKHVRTLSSLPDVEQVVVIDPCLERVRSLAGTYPALQVRASLASALDDVDAVVVATPPRTHAPLALQALEAGKHVMVEKPLATSSSEARAMLAAARERDLVIMVGHTFEYHAAVWTLRDIVRGEEFGQLYYLDTARLNMGLYQHDVNVLWDLAPHDVSILNYLVGSPPTSVECWGARHAHPALEDIAHVRLYYDEPKLEATVHVSWLHPSKTRRVTAVGSELMVVFDDVAAEERLRVHHKSVRRPEPISDDLSQQPMSYQYGDVVTPYLEVREPLVVEDQHFADCILRGAVPQTGGANGLAVVEVLEAAQTSLREGGRVPVAAPVLEAPVPALAVPLQSRGRAASEVAL
jgi:predicted dehydrogenase